MNVTVSQTGDTQVFSLLGRLDSDAAPQFERQCLQDLKSDAQALILDLSGVDYVSSAGLQTILSAGKILEARGGRLVLCVPKGLPRQIIESAGFHRLFTVCSSLEEAGKHSSGTFRVHMHKEWEVDVMTV